MIKSEEQLKKSSIKTGLVGLVLVGVLSLVFKNISLSLGYLVGFIISYAILEMDCWLAASLLKFQMAKTSVIQACCLFLKMGVYALGFLAAVKIPGLINIYCVAIGYLTVKLTIFRLAMTRR